MNPRLCCALMDLKSGEMLFQQNGSEKALIASVSKIMLAYRTIKAVKSHHQALTWDSVCTLGEEVTFPYLGGTTLDANSTIRGRINGVQQYLQPGEKISIESLLYGAMVVSGNDAASGLAVQVDGSEGKYIRAVNRQMHESPFSLSQNTEFERAYGRGCYSSASDIAKMMNVVLNDGEVSECFWQVAGALRTGDMVKITKGDGIDEIVDRENTHQFISGKYRDYLEREIGSNVSVCGKTGTWIKDYALATAVNSRGKTLIAVVLKAANERERDDSTLSLLSWGFNKANIQ